WIRDAAFCIYALLRLGFRDEATAFMNFLTRCATPDGSSTGPLQVMYDIYGELMDSIYLYDKWAQPLSSDEWEAVRARTDWVCDNWDQPDEGIWETRGGQQDFTYGRFQSWVAFDRAIRIATSRARPA